MVFRTKRSGTRSAMEDQAQQTENFTHSASGLSAPPASNRNKAGFIIKVGLILSIVAALGIAWWVYAAGREETDDAYIDGHISNISSKVSGTVTSVLVEENQKVSAGQLLVQLDPRDYQVAVDENQAALEVAQHQAKAAESKIGQTSLTALGQTTQASGDLSAGEADVDAAKASLMQAQFEVKSARAKLSELAAKVAYTKADFERYEAVYKDKAVTRQQYDKARTTYDMAVAEEQQAQENVQQSKKRELQAEANLHAAMGKLARSKGVVTSAQAAVQQEQVDKEEYAGSVAAVKRSRGALEQAQLNLSYTKISAPVDGRIGKKAVEVGQRVEPGQALLSLVHDDFWITANYKETQVGRMRVGQPVEIKVDAFPNKTFEGRVDSLSPASGAKFSMLPPDNATGNFTKVVQRIPVRIIFDRNSVGPYADRLAPGMSCVVAVLVKK